MTDKPLRAQRSKVVRFGPNVMLIRPVAAIRLAAISNAWAGIEGSLATFVEYMISERALTPTQRTADPLGATLFGQLQANRLRWNVLKVILEARLTASDFLLFKQRFNALGKTLRTAAEYRNDLVHSIYGVEVEYEGTTLISDDNADLIKTKPYSILADSTRPYELINHFYLDEVISLLTSARIALDQFADEVRHR